MALRSDFTQQVSYKGLLGWNAYTEALGSVARPAIEVELFIKEHGIPVRQLKTQELVTNVQFDPVEQRDMSTAGMFYGAPELLQVNLTGFIKTPKNSSSRFVPKDKSGTLLSGMTNLTYADIITMFLEGSINRTTGGAWQKKQPDYFISPYGNTYTKPAVMTWEPGYVSTNSKLQSFSMTLILEK